MIDDSIRRCAESVTAQLLRLHMLDAVLSHSAVVEGLPPDRLARLRDELTASLLALEQAGMADLARIREALAVVASRGAPWVAGAWTVLRPLLAPLWTSVVAGATHSETRR